MSKLTRRRTILAKIETTYNTDPTPDGATNAILIRNLNVQPQETNLVSRDLVRPFLGNFEQVPEGVHVTLDFEVEIAGSGTAGTAPAYGPLLRACGLAETITAGTSVVYAPVSSGFESATIYFNVDGTLHKITGARGTVALDMNPKQIPIFKFKITGIYNAPSDMAVPTVDYTKFVKPLTVNSQNTPAFNLFGYAGVLGAFSMDVNNTVTYRSLVGAENVLITDRQSSGDLSVEAPAIADKDFFTIAKSAQTGTLSLTHGVTAGNIFQIDASTAQVTKPAYNDQDGIQMLKMGLLLMPSAGNDEFSFTVK